MDVLVLNKITGHDDEINEIKSALKHTKSVRLYKSIDLPNRININNLIINLTRFPHKLLLLYKCKLIPNMKGEIF